MTEGADQARTPFHAHGSPTCQTSPVQPSPRPQVFDAYWRFAAERQAIFYRRLAGEPRPWTSDHVLRTFKFCNVFRASDRVSQYLIRRVAYGPIAEALPPEDVLLRVVLFRLFSKETTWGLLESATGGVRRSTLDVDRLTHLLGAARQRSAIYTSAFILAPSGNGHPKHRMHLELVASMFRPGALGSTLSRARSLEDVYTSLLEWPMIGPFLAYQIAIDLNYTQHLDFDENEFTVAGPGALRGLHKVFEDFRGRSPSYLIHMMVERQEEEFRQRGVAFGGLFGRPLHAIDCQGLFCEVDKYSRERFPELKSARVRIKQRFEPSPAAPPLFFPPKWGLNDLLPSHAGVQQQFPSLA